MDGLYNLKEMLCHELEEYGKRDTLTQSTVDVIDKLAHACKNVCKIIESKEEYGMSGSYRDNSYYGDSRYSRDGYYYDDGGMSGRRGRAMNGRFVSRDSSEMARRLREMMNEAPNESIRGEIQRLADRMEQM